jgi:signal peptidase
MTVVALPTVGGSARRLIGGAALALTIGALAIFLAVGLGMALGYRALIVRSGSMAPAIETGDMVVTRLVRPSAVSEGDVITFQDPSRDGELVTHRVVETGRQGGQISFVTKGDANTGQEEWSVDDHGTVGAMAFRIPKAGYVLAWLRTPAVRTSLVIGAALILSFLALRRIWGR